MTGSMLAAVLAGAAAWVVVPAGPARRRLPSGMGGVPGTPASGEVARRAVAARLAGAARRISRTLRSARVERCWRAGTIELCTGLAAELRAGRTPEQALRRAVEVLDLEMAVHLDAVLVAARTGGDVPVWLARAAANPGAGGLRQLAACWAVGSGTGASLASAAERLAAALRDEQAHRQEVAAQLAGPRATARLLAALPALGLAMGWAMGADPLAFLLGTPAGLACLITGLVLDGTGLYWSARLARRVAAQS